MLFPKLSKKAGMQPGAVVYVGEKRLEKTKIDIIDYDSENCHEIFGATVEKSLTYRETPTITWINITGLHEVSIIEEIGKHFGLHVLTLEDIVNTASRPKLEETDDYIFVVVKMIYIDPQIKELKSEQVSVVFGKNFVLTFQEVAGDVFNPVRDRLKKTVPRVRMMGADYLAYSLVDAIVDNYYLTIEDFDEKAESAEEELVSQPKPEHLQNIHDLKIRLLHMKRAVRPLREVIGGLDRLESSLIHDYTGPYLRDLYDHVLQVTDSVETYREMVTGLLDIYLSSVSNKMNEVMKVLTIIATIFIPLGFLAGVYGMNFDTTASPFNLPELKFPYGYLLFWLAALVIGGGLLMYFKGKRWL